MVVYGLTHNKYLIAGELPQGDRRMAGHEYLQRWFSFFSPEGVEQSRQAVRLKTVLDFVDQRDARRSSGHTLQTGNQQTRRASAEGTQRNSELVVQRYCTIAY